MNNLIMKNVVITGATSMIGISLINALLQDKEVENIYSVVRPKSRRINCIPKHNRIKIIECDINDYSNLSDKIANYCDVFYHLAWPRTATYDESLKDILMKVSCIQTVLLALNEARKLSCRNFVGAGSQSEYGISDIDFFSPETPCNPLRADGILHLAAGKLAMLLANKNEFGEKSIDCNWMRIFSVYGKYDRPNSLIMSTIKKLINREQCVFTPAEQMWDYLYEDDIGEAFYLVGKRVRGSHVYCVGSGQARQLKDYIRIIKDVVNPNAEIGIGKLSYPKDPIMSLCADITSLQKDTGWKPVVKFEEGILYVYNYIKNNTQTTQD